MGSRELLGPADVTDAQLAAMVADLLQVDRVELGDVQVEAVDYDLPAITTAARWWVSGVARSATGRAAYRIFVKHVQSWQRHPYFALLPEELRERAADAVPWRAEPAVYRSDLRHRLPDGLTLPRALGVFDLDALSAAIWIEEVAVRPVEWDYRRFARAAYLLGRLAASPLVAPLAELRGMEWTLSTYARDRLAHDVVPMLESDEVWQHPLCTAFDGELRDRLRAAGRRSVELAGEADALPRLVCHGDACPNNLLAGERDDELVMIDFGFWGGAPVGFDLTQLLVGDVQIGRRGADDLVELDELLVAAYAAGLLAEGSDLPAEQVHRGHALCLLLMTGLSSVPVDLFEAPPTPETVRIAEDRAAIARFSLDLADATAG